MQLQWAGGLQGWQHPSGQAFWANFPPRELGGGGEAGLGCRCFFSVASKREKKEARGPPPEDPKDGGPIARKLGEVLEGWEKQSQRQRDRQTRTQTHTDLENTQIARLQIISPQFRVGGTESTLSGKGPGFRPGPGSSFSPSDIEKGLKKLFYLDVSPQKTQGLTLLPILLWGVSYVQLLCPPSLSHLPTIFPLPGLYSACDREGPSS